MAKASKPAAPKTERLKTLKNKTKKEKIVTEPLSAFQEPKTGRTTTELLAELKAATSLEIHYVSVEKETDYLKLEATENNNNMPREMADTFKIPVHKKMKDAIQKLAVHAAMIVNYIDATKYKKSSDVEADLYAEFNVTSVHFKYGKKGDSMLINCTYRTPLEQAFNFTTPNIYLMLESENSYKFNSDLVKIRQNIFAKIGAYLAGTERGDANAIGMFAEANTNGQPKSAADILKDQSGEEVDVTDEY